MIRFDCMTTDELALYRAGGNAMPCVDCPTAFHVAAVSAGRCDKTPRPSGGRPVMYVLSYRVRRKRAARNRAYRANMKAQVEAVRAARRAA